MREPMTTIEAERIKDELAHIIEPYGRGPLRYIITPDQLARLVDSIKELHLTKRNLYDQLHRFKTRSPITEGDPR